MQIILIITIIFIWNSCLVQHIKDFFFLHLRVEICGNNLVQPLLYVTIRLQYMVISVEQLVIFKGNPVKYIKKHYKIWFKVNSVLTLKSWQWEVDLIHFYMYKSDDYKFALLRPWKYKKIRFEYFWCNFLCIWFSKLR